LVLLLTKHLTLTLSLGYFFLHQSVRFRLMSFGVKLRKMLDVAVVFYHRLSENRLAIAYVLCNLFLTLLTTALILRFLNRAS